MNLSTIPVGETISKASSFLHIDPQTTKKVQNYIPTAQQKATSVYQSIGGTTPQEKAQTALGDLRNFIKF